MVINLAVSVKSVKIMLRKNLALYSICDRRTCMLIWNWPPLVKLVSKLHCIAASNAIDIYRRSLSVVRKANCLLNYYYIYLVAHVGDKMWQALNPGLYLDCKRCSKCQCPYHAILSPSFSLPLSVKIDEDWQTLCSMTTCHMLNFLRLLLTVWRRYQAYNSTKSYYSAATKKKDRGYVL